MKWASLWVIERGRASSARSSSSLCSGSSVWLGEADIASHMVMGSDGSGSCVVVVDWSVARVKTSSASSAVWASVGCGRFGMGGGCWLDVSQVAMVMARAS